MYIDTVIAPNATVVIFGILFGRMHPIHAVSSHKRSLAINGCGGFVSEVNIS